MSDERERFEWRADDREHYIMVEIGPLGLSWYGEDWTCLSGGGYTIGFQTVEQFLRDGPLDTHDIPMPEQTREALRLRLERQVAAERALLTIDLVLADERDFEHAWLRLDGDTIAVLQGEGLCGGSRHRVFEGRVMPGEHVLSGYVTWYTSSQRGPMGRRPTAKTPSFSAPLVVSTDRPLEAVLVQKEGTLWLEGGEPEGA